MGEKVKRILIGCLLHLDNFIPTARVYTHWGSIARTSPYQGSRKVKDFAGKRSRSGVSKFLDSSENE